MSEARHFGIPHFLGALGFLSVLPAGSRAEFNAPAMLGHFPLVGLVLGAILAVFDSLALLIWPAPLVGILDAVLLILLTGGLHLDGLGDSADGLFSHQGRERALAIMKDSRIGVMALLAIVAVLAIKAGSLGALQDKRWLALVLVPGYSRLGLVFAMRFLPYGRPDGGTGQAFFSSKIQPQAFWGLGPLVLGSLFLGWAGLALNLVFALLVLAAIYFYRRQLGCVTGDTLGALNEVLEAGLFLLLAGMLGG
ncbi:MAG: adenosylcobinamide-GDP ribazoletransferase [Desulfohalobiaceae bacterium]